MIDHANWYGEGEVKVYRDGDTDLPTICGTGLEDYVGSAWGMGQHDAPYAGAHLVLSGQGKEAEGMGTQPDFVSFYRWHVPDPIMFETRPQGHDPADRRHVLPAGPGGREGGLRADQPGRRRGLADRRAPALLAWGICERVDDYSCTSYVYCQEAQAVPPVDVAAAIADIARRPYEERDRMEVVAEAVEGPDPS